MDALPGLEDLLDPHAHFWDRGPADRPLLGLLPPAQWIREPYPIRSGGFVTEPSALRPGDIDIERLLGLDRPPPSLTIGDLCSSVGRVYPQAWMESLLGCPILASDVSVTARPAGVQCANASSNTDVTGGPG